MQRLWLAVREVHPELVRHLVEQGGIDPNYQLMLRGRAGEAWLDS